MPERIDVEVGAAEAGGARRRDRRAVRRTARVPPELDVAARGTTGRRPAEGSRCERMAPMAAAKLYGGIDLGGTKIEAAVIAAPAKVKGSARHPTPTEGGPQAVADEMATAMREACAQAGVEPGRWPASASARRASSIRQSGDVSSARNLPDWNGSFALGADPGAGARHDGPGRQRRAGGDRRRVPPRRRQAVPLGARRLLGNRRRRRHRARRQAVARARRGRGDRSRRGAHRRAPLPVRPARVHGGLCRPRGDGGPRAQARRGRREDRPVQADGEARAHAADQRHLAARARARRQARAGDHRRGDRGARRGGGLGGQRARRRSGGARRRTRRALRSAVRRADRRRRWPRTCSTTPNRRRCWSRRSAISAVRSARAYWCAGGRSYASVTDARSGAGRRGQTAGREEQERSRHHTRGSYPDAPDEPTARARTSRVWARCRRRSPAARARARRPDRDETRARRTPSTPAFRTPAGWWRATRCSSVRRRWARSARSRSSPTAART